MLILIQQRDRVKPTDYASGTSPSQRVSFEKPYLEASVLGYFCLRVLGKLNHTLEPVPLSQLAIPVGPSRCLYLKMRLDSHGRCWLFVLKRSTRAWRTTVAVIGMQSARRPDPTR